MCTLTYVPLSKGYVVTVNRDESPARNADQLSKYTSAGKDFLIAREPVHGGTNLAISRRGIITTLLNGAFKPHDPFLRYGRSRGLILLDSLNYDTIQTFAERHTLNGVEPFTLVRLGIEIDELRWDGSKVHLKKYNPAERYIWASAQLYRPEILKKRENWFADLFKSPDVIDAILLRNFHLHGGEGDIANDMVMNRSNLVRTVSVSQAVVDGRNVLLTHHDLLGGKIHSYQSDQW
jgi:hypothetical protein